ncbi:hypothetical protein Tco_0919122 [Tanacetum coccineum]
MKMMKCQRKKEIDKLMALISLSFMKIYKPTNNNLRTSSNTSRAHQDNTPRINRGTRYDNQKRAVNVAGDRENVGTQVVRQSGIQCYNLQEYGQIEMQSKQTGGMKLIDKPKAQELEAQYLNMAQNSIGYLQMLIILRPIYDVGRCKKVQNYNINYNVFANDIEHPEQPESVNDIYLDEQGDINIPTNSLDMSNNRGQADQDEDDDLAREHLKKFQAELDRYHDVNYASKMEIDCAKAKGDLMSYKMESQKSLNEHTRKINDLNQTISEMKKELVAHQETISIMSQEKKALNKFYKTREDKEIEKFVEIILFIVDSGCSKHMTGNLKLLTNFVEKFLGTVKFRNDQIAPILGYRDLVQGTITIKRVYYVEGLNHNLFSVDQFCNADMEVAFWKSTYYIRDLKGNDLLTGSRGIDLYSITLQGSPTPNPICVMAKATSSQAWL